MTGRQKFILRLAVSYLNCNLDDALEAFSFTHEADVHVAGKPGDAPTTAELEHIYVNELDGQAGDL